MILPAIDLGLMADHLSVHEGVIAKLKCYSSMVENTELKRIVDEQLTIMREHVHIMLRLIYPNQIGTEHAPYQSYESPERNPEEGKMTDKHIALEGHATANFMAKDNFTSATMMKAPQVKHIHFNMAWQQVSMSEKYYHYIQKMGWSHPPMSDAQEQIKTFQHYQHLLKE